VETEILLTHGPPAGILDKTRRGDNAGCAVLTGRLAAGQLPACRLHVFGHIHEGHGAVATGAYPPQTVDGITQVLQGPRLSVNAAVKEIGQAIIVDLKN
jgi:hypothetical protein